MLIGPNGHSDMMWTFSVWSTGCEAKSEVKGCTDGWFEFTCKYPGTSTIHSIDLVSPKGTLIKSTKKNVWEDSGDGLVSLYHDTKKKALRVAINQFLPLEFWGYQCNFYQEHKSSPVKPELVVGKRQWLLISFLLNLKLKLR